MQTVSRLSGVYRPDATRCAAILKRWPRLTYEDLEVAGDDRTLLIFAIMERYGRSWNDAERAVADWERLAA